MKSDVVGGQISYHFEFSEPYEGRTHTSAQGKGFVKFADIGIGWRIGSIRAKDTGGMEWLWVTQAALSPRALVFGISTRKPGAQLMWGKFFFNARSGQDPQPFKDWFRQWSGPNDEVHGNDPPNVGGWRNLNGWQVWLGGDRRNFAYDESPDLELWIPKYISEHPA